METIKLFLQRFDEFLFGRHIFAFIAVTVISVAVQCLLFWIGGLFSSFHHLGIAIDAALGIILAFPLIALAGFNDFRGDWNLMFTMFALIGIYLCLVYCSDWYALIVCLFVLLYNKGILVELGFYPYILYQYLLYCIGAYVAMLILGLKPAADIYGFALVSLTTFFLWLNSAFNDCHHR